MEPMLLELTSDYLALPDTHHTGRGMVPGSAISPLLGGLYLAPPRKLRPARQSLDRLCERARRLYEQGADPDRLRRYVHRWYAWLHGGLRGRVSTHGRFTRIWITVLRHLKYLDATILHP